MPLKISLSVDQEADGKGEAMTRAFIVVSMKNKEWEEGKQI